VKSFFTMASRRPIVTIIVVIAITLGLGAAAVSGFRIETNLDEYMPSDHPAFVYSERAEEWFNISDGVMLAVYNPDGIFQPATLQKIADLGDALGALEGINPEDVMSLATADNITGSDWGLEVGPFFGAVPGSEDELAALRAAVQNNPMVQGRMVSEDGTAALVIARLSEGNLSDNLYAQIRELEQSFEGPEEVFVAGRPIVEGALAELGPADMARMGPLVLIVIAVVLLLLLRSVRNMILSMLVVGMSVIWTFGLMALLGIPVYAVSTMIPVMLVAIGVAYSIHVFNSATVHLEQHPEATPRHLGDHVIATITRPVVMTAVTTMVGFLSLLTSAVLPVRYFGLFTAFGVFSAMVLSLSLIPSSFLLFGVANRARRSEQPDHSNHLARRIARTITRRWKPIVLVAAVFLVGSAVGIPRVWIDSSFISNFAPDSDIARTDQFVNDRFAGTSTLNVILEADSPDRFKNPELLMLMADLQQEVERSDAVGDSLAITDYVKRMHQVMNEDQTEYYVIPESQDLIAQYLLLFEMSADPASLEQVIDYDYKRANITVQLKSDSSRTLDGIIETVDSFSGAFESFGVSLNYAGSGYRALVFAQLILRGQIISLALSLIIVILLLSVMFRSVKIGLIGSVPIMLTAVANFGVMGLLGVPLSMSTALISSIAVGIGIDYAIHFIERYKEYLVQFRDRSQAAELTMHHSGRAILFNATVVATGFAVLLFSVFPPNRQVGGLTALNMAVSFLGTVTVMFLLLHRIERTALSKTTVPEEGHNEAHNE
jgi:uncharacterized protein